MSEPHQKSIGVDAGPSWSRVRPSRSSSGPGPRAPQAPRACASASSPQVSRAPAAGAAQPAGGPPGPGSQGAQGGSGHRLLAGLGSMKILEEDADQDSASDLSDSERVPLPPAPLTPPDLHLRAEEIDPTSLDLHPGPGAGPGAYGYPDFLPPPCRAWDLRDPALLQSAERRAEAAARAGPWGGYVHRLLQLGALQLRAAQAERSRGARARKKEAPREEGPPPRCAPEACPRRGDGPPGTRPPPQRQTPETRAEESSRRKAGPSPRPPRPWDSPRGDHHPKMEANGNLRLPRHAAVLLDPAEAGRAPRTQAHAHLKKKGNVNNCGPGTASSEKKLRTSGGKPSACRLK
ncbi:protein FAM217B [Perognathus longimembris pacificus]|uniref:protein FAM217B n=1 Tax=Perognathus longimembris pacificus TaxID=214514 RepID=UPI002019DD12|nr:protein FAM217B [Perognathus longimembris pacificus]